MSNDSSIVTARLILIYTVRKDTDRREDFPTLLESASQEATERIKQFVHEELPDNLKPFLRDVELFTQRAVRTIFDRMHEGPWNNGHLTPKVHRKARLRQVRRRTRHLSMLGASLRRAVPSRVAAQTRVRG
jgi:hypothetical protein